MLPNTLGIMTLGIMTLGIITLTIAPLSILILSVLGIIKALRITTLSISIKYHCAECCHD